MKIEIKRFNLRHNGVNYKTGKVIEIEDEALAKKLIANSDGALAVVPEVEKVDNEEELTHKTDAEVLTEEKTNAPTEDGVELPAADPATAVETGKKK